MSIKNLFTVFLCILILGVAGCSSDNADSPTETSNPESQLLGSVYNALSSASNGMSGAGAASLALPSVSCDENGWPVDGVGDDIYPSSDASYAFKMIYCMGTSDSQSPETALGTLTIARAMLCALGSVTYDGSLQSSTYTFSTGSCFPQSVVDEMVGDGNDTVTLSFTANESPEAGWDYVINLDTSSFGGESMNFKYKNSNNVIAFANNEVSSAGQNSSWMVSVDAANGFVRFEYLDDRIASDGWNRHARLLLECGSVDADMNCTGGLANAEGIWAGIWQNGANFYSRMATLRGNPTDGFRTVGYESAAGGSLNDLNAAANYNYGSAGFGPNNTTACESEDAGTCAGDATGLVFADGALFFLLLHQAGQDVDATYPTNWFDAQTAPASFTSLTTALSE